MQEDGDQGLPSDDDEVNAICASLQTRRNARVQPRAKKRWRSEEREEDEEREGKEDAQTQMVAFDELVQASRVPGTGHFDEVMFWSRGLVGMTPLDAVNGNRPKELERLLNLDPTWIDAGTHDSEGGLSLLQTAVLRGHFKCARVLIRKGAIGAVDIVAKTDSMLRLEVLPYILDGCTREELREMERKRLADKKPPIARLLLRTIRQSFYFGDPDSGTFLKKKMKTLSPCDEARYRKTLELWIDRTGADDFRDCQDQSLQDDATNLEEWSVLYALQLRAVLAFLNVHRWTKAINPELCRIHRDVILTHVVPAVFRPVYCFICRRGVKFSLVCGGCGVVEIACEACQWNDMRLRRPRCTSCRKPVCPDCMMDCLARPEVEDCKAVFCSRCGPATCPDCVWLQVRLAQPSSSSSSEEDEEDEEEPPSDDEDPPSGDDPDANPDNDEGEDKDVPGFPSRLRRNEWGDTFYLRPGHPAFKCHA